MLATSLFIMALFLWREVAFAYLHLRQYGWIYLPYAFGFGLFLFNMYCID